MFVKIITNKIILTIIFITALLMIYLSVYLPKITLQNTIDIIVKNSINSVEQIKLTRAYYVEEIVGDIKKYAPQIKFDYDHDGIDGKIAFPTSLVHELSDIYSKNTGMKFQLYSNYPFKIKKDRVLSESQKEALEFIENNNESIWIKRDTLDGKEVLRVAIADIMNQQACVDCHNAHIDKMWPSNMWKLGDKRGVLEVVTPLDESIQANTAMKNKILFSIFIAMLILVIYYSISLIRRENELIDENDLLDKKVKEEVKKNLQKEKQLMQQSRSAAMGDMMASIIHQWKQPINIISLTISSLKLQREMKILDEAFLDSKLDEVENQVNIMNVTMDDFRNFFKPAQAKIYEINASIEKILKMVDSIYEKDGIDIQFEHDEKLFTLGYENELNQVFINLFNNARDAILETESVQKTIYVKTYRQDLEIIITVTDCAGGIKEDVIDIIFEPYMSTKSDQNGTGIGLDMSRTIIEKVQGSIEAQNVITPLDGRDYKGAQFIIKLQAYDDKPI